MYNYELEKQDFYQNFPFQLFNQISDEKNLCVCVCVSNYNQKPRRRTMDIASPEYMVLQALQLACSQDTVQLKQAETKLAEWEIEPGFYTMLLQVFSNQTVDVNVRWMAAVYFKNGVNKYWRRNVQK